MVPAPWARSTLAVVLLFVFSPTTKADEARPFTLLERVGEQIFNDSNLSNPPGTPCASCHDQGHGFADPAARGVSAGSRAGVFGSRNAPSLSYAAATPPFALQQERGKSEKMQYIPVGGLFLDGRAATLEEQARGPLLNPLEMNNASVADVAAKLRAASYADDLRAALGDGAGKGDDQLVRSALSALAAFERSSRFMTFTSKFDAVLRGAATFSAAEQRGFALFKDPQKGNCIACHAGEEGSTNPRDWLFTDFTFDALGVPRNPRIAANEDAAQFDLGLCAELRQRSVPQGVDAAAFCGAFKVPTLRNVAVTGPYFHNGAVATLRDVVSFYVTRDTQPDRWYRGGATSDDLPGAYAGNVNHDEVPYDRKAGEAPRLNAAEIDDMVAFLNTLTDRPE